jgi:arylsulfatase A-like enzyme
MVFLGASLPSLSLRPLFTVLLALVTLVALDRAIADPPAVDTKQFVVIVFDDMRVDDMKYMPRLASLAERRGQSLNHAFVSCPLCCPSRSSLLTGLLVSKHGVTGNSVKLEKPTIFTALHAAGVKTGLVGKYLNSHKGRPLPEFDYWASFKGGNVTNWLRPRLNINGEFQRFDEYISDIVLDQAAIFTKRYASDPYVLYMNFTAPHRPATTPPGFTASCNDVELPDHFNEVDPTAPPEYQALPLLDAEKLLHLACARAKSLKYLDYKVSKVIRELISNGVTVFVVSDNGVMLGEYRLEDKGTAYPETVRTPFLVFNYESIDPARVISLIDIPASILKSFAVEPPGYALDGIPLEEPRTSATIEYFGERLNFTAKATPGLIRVLYMSGFKQELAYSPESLGRGSKR